MKYQINNNCIACGYCAVMCPDNAVETGYGQPACNREGPKMYADPFIINDNCTGCGECVSICPTGAILEDIQENG
ncbi:MAG: 4Fe-4S binding protein [Bacillota bacterium]